MPDYDLLPLDDIRFVQEGDWWVAHHDESGVTSQGKTRDEAHEMITEAVLLFRGEIGESIDTWEREAELLADLGFSDEEIADIKERRNTKR